MTTRHVSHVKLRHDLRLTEQQILAIQPAVGDNDIAAITKLESLTEDADRLRSAISDSAAQAGQGAGWWSL